jgi:SAM-dependent methyltransferase
MGSAVADQASEIVGIDISDVAVREATARAEQAGLNAKYLVMDAESLSFPDQAFDLICSVAVLHHLDLRKGYAEIARVLRPNGTAVFMEPLGHNPLINLYRWLTPTMRTPDEHPLLMRDLELARNYFDRVEVRFFVLSSLAAMFVHRTRVFRPVLHSLEKLDQLLFKVLPPIRRYAWQVVIVLEHPKSHSGSEEPPR